MFYTNLDTLTDEWFPINTLEVGDFKLGKQHLSRNSSIHYAVNCDRLSWSKEAVRFNVSVSTLESSKNFVELTKIL